MSLVYQYPKNVVLDLNQWNDSKPALEKAIQKAKCTAAHVAAFIKEFESKKSGVRDTLQTIGSVALGKIKGLNAIADMKAKHPTASNVLGRLVLSPQMTFQMANFDLSLHLKGDLLQMQLSYKGGGSTQVVMNVKKP